MPNKDAALLPSPWNEFLKELDNILTEPLELHCIGGFILVYFYGLPRTTGDIDYYTAIPANTNLDELAGEGSPLHKKQKVCLHRVAVTSLPEAYESRLTDMAPGQLNHLRLRVPDPYDCILSKLERNSSKDRDDADYLFRSKGLDVEVLRERYQKELRPYLPKEKWHDQMLDMWIDIFNAPSQS
jgi:hypothetical protein